MSSPAVDCQCVPNKLSTMLSGGYALDGSLALQMNGTLSTALREPCCVSRNSSGGLPHVMFAQVFFK